MATVPMMLTAAVIATATGGQLAAGSADRAIDGFSIDSRTLQPGDLFFAIVAARDGHAFVTDALARGAAGVVVSAPISANLRRDAVVIHVADTTAALQTLARFVRRQSAATVIAITGSAGKTTTKEAIASLLTGHFQVTKNQGNLNNHLGLPLSLLELRHGTDVAVMELGMNHAGEIRVLVGIAEPELRVWTNVGDAHIGYFESREAIADAKAEILEGATAADVLVCNADDGLVMDRVRHFAGRTITFGRSSSADVGAAAVQDLGLDGTRLQLRTTEGIVDLHVPLIGEGNLSNVLAAAAVAAELGVTLEEIARRTGTLTPAAHRGVVLRLAGGVTVIDDSYNSNPAALRLALEMLGRAPRTGRKIAVLGEMLELGAHARRLHEESGRVAALVGLDRLITVGGEPAKALADAAIRSGMRQDAVAWTASSVTAAHMVAPTLAAGDAVLVKGSRGIETDTVVDRITEAFS